MRVTRTVKDYIYHKVEEAIPETPESLEFKRVMADLNAKTNALNEEMARAFEEQFQSKIDAIKGDATNLRTSITYPRVSVYEERYGKDTLRAKADRAEEARRCKIGDKVEEICITLELGGTKQDLDDMIAALNNA